MLAAGGISVHQEEVGAGCLAPGLPRGMIISTCPSATLQPAAFLIPRACTARDCEQLKGLSEAQASFAGAAAKQPPQPACLARCCHQEGRTPTLPLPSLTIQILATLLIGVACTPGLLCYKYMIVAH